MGHFEPLDARERLAFDIEDAHVHLHAATACVLEAGPLAREGGGVEIDRIRAFVESRLYRVPLCRKRLARVPLTGETVWVDDESFNLQYHVRHTHLPVPGDERLLKRLCGRLASQRLDPERPLWELWVVEGLEGERCAIVANRFRAKSSQIAVGGEAISRINSIKADLCFLGINAIDGAGVSDNDWEVVQVKQSMIKASKKTVVLSITEKINTRQRFAVCGLDEIDTIITDSGPGNPLFEGFVAAGGKLL